MTTLTTIEERELLQTQRSFITVKTLAEQAKATFVGISQIDWNAPLHQDGFINDEEVTQLMELGAVGEIAGWVYDRQGVLIQCVTNSRVAGVGRTTCSTADYWYCRRCEKSGVDFGGSAWEVDRRADRRRSCRPKLFLRISNFSGVADHR